MSRHASVQATRLHLDAIEDDLVCLTGGRYRAVLEVGAINLGLFGPLEQEVLMAGFAACLNSLSFPVQIVVRVLPVHLEGYLAELERRSEEAASPALAELARDHAAFLRRLARNRTLLERRCYVVIPAQRAAEDAGTARGTWWPLRLPVSLGHADGTLGITAARKQLTFRCEELGRQLGRCGLAGRRLQRVELAQLYFACWCPELARTQRLRQELADYTALVVGRGVI